MADDSELYVSDANISREALTVCTLTVNTPLQSQPPTD